MPYMNADTGNKVGFRPYLRTDAFAAAHLSGVPEDPGLGVYHLNRPFDPWELYADVHETGMHGLSGLGDLGQNHPFKPEAWQLHGMGAADSVTQQAVSELVNAGHLSQQQAAAILNGTLDFRSAVGVDPTSQSAWYDLVGQFREVNLALQDLERRIVQDPAAARAIGRDLAQKRTQYSDLASEFVRYYATVMGSAPPGLSGLGIIPVVGWAAGAAVFIVLAVIALYAIHAWIKSDEVKRIIAETAQTAEDTDRYLVEQLKAAQASGDTPTARTISDALAKRGGSRQGGTPNIPWSWIALSGAGLFALFMVVRR